MWKFFNPFGQEKLISVGAALATLPTVENALAADVTIAATGTFYDGPSITLPAGTWFVVGHLTIQTVTNGGEGDIVKLWDGTTVYASSEAHSVNDQYCSSHTLQAVITLATTTTLKLSGTSNFVGGKIKAATNHYGSGNHASKLTAIMLSPPTAMPIYAGAANFVTLAQFASLTPVDGMTVNVLVDGPTGVIWTFRYNAGSASAYKWEFLGGSDLYSSGFVTATAIGLTYVDLAAAPILTVPRNGEYQLIYEWQQCGAALVSNQGHWLTPKYGAAVINDNDGVQLAGQSGIPITAMLPLKVMTAADLIKLQVKVSPTPYTTGADPNHPLVLKLRPRRIS